MKIFFVDTETTGLSDVNNDIIQIAGAFWENGNIIDLFDFKCQPVNWNSITPMALQCNGFTIKQLKTFEEPKKTFRRLYDIMSANTTDDEKWRMGGQNANKFDNRFINNWWNKHKDPSDKSFYDFVDLTGAVDLMDISKPLKTHGKLKVENVKLGTLTTALEVTIDGKLHDALTDIKATMECVWKTADMASKWITEDAQASKHFSPGVNELLKFRSLLG